MPTLAWYVNLLEELKDDRICLSCLMYAISKYIDENLGWFSYFTLVKVVFCEYIASIAYYSI